MITVFIELFITVKSSILSLSSIIVLNHVSFHSFIPHFFLIVFFDNRISMLHYLHERQYREFTFLYKMKVEKQSYEVINSYANNSYSNAKEGNQENTVVSYHLLWWLHSSPRISHHIQFIPLFHSCLIIISPICIFFKSTKLHQIANIRIFRNLVQMVSSSSPKY